MGCTEIVTAWTAFLQPDVFPGLAVALVKALALFSAAVAEARHCQSGRVAAKARGRATAASQRRRWERWLAHPRFDAAAVQRDLARAVWQRWPAARATLILDETPKANDLRCLCVRLAYRRRAVPLASACYRLGRPSGGLPRLVRRLLDQATEHRPARVAVVLLADRGLAWPALVDYCTRRGWHYLLRLQGQTRVRLATGRVVTARDLAPARGAAPWLGRAEVFKKAGWRAGAVGAWWAASAAEPWLLLMDGAACAGRWRQYARRMWIEEAFRDEKSQGFQWQQSRVNDPVRAGRLLAILGLATLLALSAGSWLVKRGARRWFDPRQRWRLSVFQLGLHGLDTFFRRPGLNWRPQFYFYPS